MHSANGLTDLDAKIADLETSLRDPACRQRYPALHDELANALAERYQHTGQREDLDRAIAHAEAGVHLAAHDDGQKPDYLNTLANRLSERFALDGERADLNAAIAQAEAAVALTAEGNSRKPAYLSNLASHLSERFALTGAREDLALAIAHAEAAVRLAPEGSSDRPALLNTLAGSLAERFALTGARPDLDAAIAHAEAAVGLTPDGHSGKSQRLNNLANRLHARFALTGNRADLDAAIAHVEAAVELTADGHANRPMYLSNLAAHLSERFALSGARTDLDAAILHAEGAVRLTPARHGDRPMYLSNLAAHLSERFVCTGTRADLDAAIAYAETAVRLTPEESRGRPAYLNNLANRLSARFVLTGAQADLDAAILHAEAAVRLTPLGHSDRPMYLNSLAAHKSRRFTLTRKRSDLDVAIAHTAAAVRLTSEGHRDRPTYLGNLAAHLSERFALTGVRADLDAAILSAEAAARLAPEGHRERPMHLNNLAGHLFERFRFTAALADVDAAIGCAEEAVHLTPEGHGERPARLDNLANYRSERFRQTGTLSDLHSAIAHARDAMLGWQSLALESEDARTIAARSAACARRLINFLIQAGEPAQLVSVLEMAKAVRLRADLVGSGRAPAHLDATGRARYLQVRAELRRLRSGLRRMDSFSDHTGMPTNAAVVASLRSEELQLRAERMQLETGDRAFGASPLDYDGVRSHVCEARAAIVYLQPLDGAPDRLLVVIIHPASLPGGPAPEDLLEIAGLGRLSLQELLLAQSKMLLEAQDASKLFTAAGDTPLGWLTACWAANRDSRDAEAHRRWLDVVAATVARLGRDLMGPVGRRLAALGIARVVLIPGEALGLLPLHAAPVGADAAAFGEVFETCYAPSATALSHATRPLPAGRIIGIANPDGSLAFSDFEMRAVARVFQSSSSIRHGSAARRDWLLAEAGGGDILALSTHAIFTMGRPEQSCFVLAHPGGLAVPDGRRGAVQAGCEKLSLDDILRGELRLAPGALVVADACETGQIVPGDSAEEFVGFPAAFLTSGASAVVASLWSVADLSTALLMEDMYRRIKAGEAPVSALAKAAHWMRRLSRAELRARLELEAARAQQHRKELISRRKSMTVAEKMADPSYDEAVRMHDALVAVLAGLDGGPEHPFCHPYYWAPFALHGNGRAVSTP